MSKVNIIPNSIIEKLGLNKYDISLENLGLFKKEVKELYELGYSSMSIAYAMGLTEFSNSKCFDCGGTMVKTKRGATKKIVFDILGFSSWDEYRKDHNNKLKKLRD